MRIDGYGRVDRSAALRFSFDGKPLQGFFGDTLASALMGAGVRLVGRSFKYHRPRGLLTDGAAEPNALVTVDGVPNLRATMIALTDGLAAVSQNRWPALEFDLLAVNDLFAPFLGAGFYYKTFMWPRGFWERVYEPLIRRAAGLGALTGPGGAADSGFAFCDLLVIGAGPAGLMAALTAAEAGADVILVDDAPAPGGRLLSETEEVGGRPGADWAASVTRRLTEMENVRLMPRTTVTGVYDQGSFGAYDEGAACFWRIVARRSVLAAGALERPIAFRDNDRPGVMLASALRGYLHRYGVAPGRRVAVFCNNDDAHRTAADLRAAGLQVAALFDTRPEAVCRAGDVPFFPGAQVLRAHGRRALRAVTYRTAQGRVDRIAVDALGVSGGFNPTLHLTCHLGARPVWSEPLAAFVPRPGAVPGMRVAGAASGVFSTHGCLETGAQAGAEAATVLGFPSIVPKLPSAMQNLPKIVPFWAVPGKGRAWLDFQNDVTVKDVAQAAAENYRSVEHMKRYTTQGMAADQGKSSNIGALAVLAEATGRSIPDTGTTTYRPPFAPVPIKALGAGSTGKGYAPQRLTTSHAASVARGAPMVEAGLWYRPSYFPRPGERTWRDSCDREVHMVRSTVGVCDVSTLGKIALTGPDVGRFLDLVYANGFSTLKPGRVRYGLMLREDGHVLDDGTTARLSEHDWVMTTTTAAAGQVMMHLDFVRQAYCADLDLFHASVTENHAQFAVAGPRSRDLLNGLLESPIDDHSFPYMQCGAVRLGGVEARLFRISFSGEHAYEIAVPARYGTHVFDLLVAQAEALGGGAYGMEALNVMRVEKGFPTHAEMHGRVTAFDLGLGRMVSGKKDCIGKVMAGRPGLMDPTRERLVGLRPVDPQERLLAGAHLYPQGGNARPEQDQGYITSACFSPTLGHDIALGFVKNGPERWGEQVVMQDLLRGVATLCEITDTVAYDPDGGRLRG